VTVKHRIGIDAIEDYAFVRDFVGTVAAGGCDVFIVHARNAVLKGLSPKENREVPPLRYDVVHHLKRDFPALAIVTNGGLSDWDGIERELNEVDGVMLGRLAYHDPYFLAQLDWKIFCDERPVRSRAEVIAALVPYAEAQRTRGVPLRAITRHILGLYHGRSGGRRFRRILSDSTRLRDAGPELLQEALAAVEPVPTCAEAA
jgi:tRNA-dihydrouridine synthase A